MRIRQYLRRYGVTPPRPPPPPPPQGSQDTTPFRTPPSSPPPPPSSPPPPRGFQETTSFRAPPPSDHHRPPPITTPSMSIKSSIVIRSASTKLTTQNGDRERSIIESNDGNDESLCMPLDHFQLKESKVGSNEQGDSTNKGQKREPEYATPMQAKMIKLKNPIPQQSEEDSQREPDLGAYHLTPLTAKSQKVLLEMQSSREEEGSEPEAILYIPFRPQKPDQENSRLLQGVVVSVLVKNLIKTSEVNQMIRLANDTFRFLDSYKVKCLPVHDAVYSFISSHCDRRAQYDKLSSSFRQQCQREELKKAENELPEAESQLTAVQAKKVYDEAHSKASAELLDIELALDKIEVKLEDLMERCKAIGKFFCPFNVR